MPNDSPRDIARRGDAEKAAERRAGGRGYRSEGRGQARGKENGHGCLRLSFSVARVVPLLSRAIDHRGTRGSPFRLAFRARFITRDSYAAGGTLAETTVVDQNPDYVD